MGEGDAAVVAGAGAGLGQAEVHHLDLPAGGHHHVAGLEVAVQDAVPVRLGDTVDDLQGNAEGVVDVEGFAPQPYVEGFALDELHGDEQPAVALVHLVNAADVGMVERGRGPGFAGEPLARGFVASGFRRQQLQGDAPTEIGVFGKVDLGHATRAEQRAQFVASESRSGRKARHDRRPRRLYAASVAPSLLPPPSRRRLRPHPYISVKCAVSVEAVYRLKSGILLSSSTRPLKSGESK